MMIKLIGCLCLCLSGGALAISLYRFQRKKLTTMDGFIALLLYIKGQVDCFARPINEILQTLPAEIAMDCNCRDGAESVEEMIEESRAYLDEEPLRLLRAFAAEFGSTFREEQTRRCDYYISALREKRVLLEAQANSKSRSGGAIWICGILSLMILLW